MVTTSILLCLVGALILLDKQAIGELGISQPIIACPLIGHIFGAFEVGLFLGTALQLVWIGALPLGAKEPTDNQSAGVVAISSYLLAKKINIDVNTEKLMFVGLLLGSIASLFGQFSSQLLKRINNQLFLKATFGLEDKEIITAHFMGLLTFFLRNLVLMLFFQILLIFLAPLIKLLPQFSIAELIALPLGIGIAGIARLVILPFRLALRELRYNKQIIFSILGMITGFILWIILKL
ncbi:MAG: PTS sugar transporter subunit IIC [candidate division WOR-3 bacterium]|nr:PTS sugar transporter subunit IIC [candidate division WOR-3 bacterium]